MNRYLTHAEFNDLFGPLTHREISDWQKEVMGVFDELPKAVFVVASSLYRATIWANSVGHRISNRDFSYVSDSHKLRGLKNITIVFLDGWEKHPDAKDIARECDRMKSLERAEFKYEQNFQEEPSNTEDISGQRQETPESQ